MKIVMVGQGAFGRKHLDGLKNIHGRRGREPRRRQQGVDGSRREAVRHSALRRRISARRSRCPGVEAAILTSPTQVHAAQAEQVMNAGKHVEIEIPIADSLADAKQAFTRRRRRRARSRWPVTRAASIRRTCGWHNRIKKGELKLQQLVVQTYFFRRKNINLEGKPRSWTDHLLWHHACHTVDLFHYQTGEVPSVVHALQGPLHPELKIAMDMSIGMRTPSGVVCNLSLSFNNDGPQGTFFRYICDNGTYIARYDDLFDGKDNKIDLSGVAVSMNGIELQDREFVAAIREKREPFSSVAQVLPAMETLDRLEKSLDG